MGTVSAPLDGPDTDQTVDAGSGNEITASSSLYTQGFYRDPDCSNQDSEYPDEFNGNSSGERGFHYHVTVTQDEDGSPSGDFPFDIGANFYGGLHDDTLTQCESNMEP